MQTFDSGGALLVRPRPYRTYAAALAIAVVLTALPPLVGAYLLIVA